MLSLVCTQCGGEISVSGDLKKLTCPYCGSSFLINDSVHCECGRNSSGRCVECSIPLCSEHSLSLEQFDLNEILEVSVPTITPQEKVLRIQSLINQIGDDAILCAVCFDKKIEDWIDDTKKMKEDTHEDENGI